MLPEQRNPAAYHLFLKTPASWYGDRAKDSLPCGNGFTGLLCAGGIERNSCY